MSSRYSSLDCPICGKSLADGEVVVCPDCGAPYHRECYLKEGQCIFPTLHLKGEDWKPPAKEFEQEEKFSGREQMKCPRCGTENPPSGLFCQVCGSQLNAQEAAVNEQADGMAGRIAPPFNPMGGGMYGGGEMPLNPYQTPFGGVAPDEVIDEVPAKDLAIYVGRNSHYYLPHFKMIATHKSKIINWASFIFTGGHFLYRKMYLLGLFVIVLNLILAIPNAVLMYQNLSLVSVPGFTPADVNSSLSNLTFICSALSMGIRLVCGMFSNTLYKHHVYKNIKKIKQQNLLEDEYYGEIAKKGSVATKLITTLLIIYVSISVIGMYAMLFLGL